MSWLVITPIKTFAFSHEHLAWEFADDLENALGMTDIVVMTEQTGES